MLWESDLRGAGVDGCSSWLLVLRYVADFLPTIMAGVRSMILTNMLPGAGE
jgi:hypothetical protein